MLGVRGRPCAGCAAHTSHQRGTLLLAGGPGGLRFRFPCQPSTPSVGPCPVSGVCPHWRWRQRAAPPCVSHLQPQGRRPPPHPETGRPNPCGMPEGAGGCAEDGATRANTLLTRGSVPTPRSPGLPQADAEGSGRGTGETTPTGKGVCATGHRVVFPIEGKLFCNYTQGELRADLI